jgi:DNA mismatch endonuclease, patch repair protein
MRQHNLCDHCCRGKTRLMDVHPPEKRSYNMSRIRGKNTRPEITVRKWLWSNGYRYRLRCKALPCKPDIVFPGRMKAIFIHGCFWHRHDCRYFQWPKTNAEFWKKKIDGNVLRDQKNYDSLTGRGWQYLLLWECELKDDQDKIWKRLEAFMGRPRSNL